MSLKLYQLIKSLNGTEKRYFRLRAQMIETEKPKQYLKVFAVLAGMQVYDELLFLGALNDSGVSTKNIHADKNYLYNSILDALSDFYAHHSGEMKLLQCLTQIEVLYVKNLTSQALMQLRKAKKIARKYELFTYHLQLFEWEHKLLDFPNKAKILKEQTTDSELVLSQYTTFTAYNLLYKKANLLRKKITKTQHPDSIKEWENEIAKHPLLRTENIPDSFRARIRYYQIKTAHYYVLDDKEKEYEYNWNIVNMMEANPHFIKEYPELYIAIFSRFLVLTKSINSVKYETTLAQFRKIPSVYQLKSNRLQAKVFVLHSGTELTRKIDTGCFEEAAASLDEIKAGFKVHEGHINPTFLLASRYRFAYVYMATNQYPQALKELNDIAQMDKMLRPDMFRFAKLLTLITHLELGNKSLIPYLKKSASLHLKKGGNVFKIERIFLTYISKLKQAKDKKDFKRVMIKLREQMDAALQNEHEQKALLYFDFISWIDSKLKGISFEAAKQVREQEKNRPPKMAQLFFR